MSQEILMVGPTPDEKELIELATKKVAGREILSHSHSVSTLVVDGGNRVREFFRMTLVVRTAEVTQ